MVRCNTRGRGRAGMAALSMLLIAVLGSRSVHAELLFDKPATSADEATVRNSGEDLGPNGAAAETNDEDSDVLFSKSAPAPVIPHRPKDLQCAPLKKPRSWDRALGWRTPDQPLPSWGWERGRWCGDLDRLLDKLSNPVDHLARWASCEGAVAAGGPPNTTIAPMCAARYDPRDWVELRPRLTVYSLGTWTYQGQSCPSAVVEIAQLSGVLSGSRTHVLVPLEGNCPAWHGFDPMEKNWTIAPVTPAMIQEGQLRWAGYDGAVPDGWSVGFTPVGQSQPPAMMAIPSRPASSSLPAGVAVQPPLQTRHPRR